MTYKFLSVPRRLGPLSASRGGRVAPLRPLRGWPRRRALGL